MDYPVNWFRLKKRSSRIPKTKHTVACVIYERLASFSFQSKAGGAKLAVFDGNGFNFQIFCPNCYTP